MHYKILTILAVLLFFQSQAYSNEIQEYEEGKRYFRQCSSCHNDVFSNSNTMNEQYFLDFAKNYRQRFNSIPLYLEVHQRLNTFTDKQLKDIAHYINTNNN